MGRRKARAITAVDHRLGSIARGGFAQLQQSDGVSRCFCLTSIPVSQATYPRAHTCFNRIDLPLYDRPANEMPRALEFVITNATAVSMDPTETCIYLLR